MLVSKRKCAYLTVKAVRQLRRQGLSAGSRSKHFVAAETFYSRVAWPCLGSCLLGELSPVPWSCLMLPGVSGSIWKTSSVGHSASFQAWEFRVSPGRPINNQIGKMVWVRREPQIVVHFWQEVIAFLGYPKWSIAKSVALSIRIGKTPKNPIVSM